MEHYTLLQGNNKCFLLHEWTSWFVFSNELFEKITGNSVTWVPVCSWASWAPWALLSRLISPNHSCQCLSVHLKLTKTEKKYQMENWGLYRLSLLSIPFPASSLPLQFLFLWNHEADYPNLAVLGLPICYVIQLCIVKESMFQNGHRLILTISVLVHL